MRKHIVLGAVLALGVGAQAMAAEGLSYNYAQVGYERGDVGSVTLSGFSLAGSAAIGEMFFGSASYSDLSKSGDHIKLLSAGVGGHYALGMSVDLVGGVSFENLKFPGASESGWGVGAGLRGVVGNAELHGGIKHVDIGDFGTDMNFTVGGLYHFTEMFSAGLDVTKWDDLDLTQYGLTLRYTF